MNTVQLVGRIASAIKLEEITTTEGLRPRATFLLAVRPRSRDAEPEWIRVECWGGQADSVAKHCSKGRLVSVAGHLRGRFLTPEGLTQGGKLRLGVVANAVDFLDRGPVELRGNGAEQPSAK